MIRVHGIPYSTNVERVALAAGVKGIEVEWISHDPGDRTALVELSGQGLVPVAEIDGEIVLDSMRIVERLETLEPEPAFYPADPAARAEISVFIEWFNFVWKGPPNQLDAELSAPAPDPAKVEELTQRAHEWTPLFEAMLGRSPYLGGEALGAADVCAFPFLKYAVVETPPEDDEPFHRVLERILKPADSYPRLCDWVRRVDVLPRA